MVQGNHTRVSIVPEQDPVDQPQACVGGQYTRMQIHTHVGKRGSMLGQILVQSMGSCSGTMETRV
jgi:hypothetical protein